MTRGGGTTEAYENFDENAIVAKLRPGKVIAWSKLGRYIDFGADREYDNWLQRVPDLKKIDYVLHVQIDYGIPTSTKTTSVGGKSFKQMVYGPIGKSITGNIVGMTLLGGLEETAGGTLTVGTLGTSVYVEVIAVGPP